MNVLYIHTHDSGRILSPYGYKVPTPAIEKFAGEAAVFRNAYCVGPTCSPSRAGLLTGTYPHQNGMLGLSQRGFSLDFGKHLVPYLNCHGYHTVLCGIQHEAGWYLDRNRGTETIGYQEEITRDSSGFRQEDLVDWDKENAMEACKWLRRWDRSKPFFLSYGMYATHRRFPDKTDGEINEDLAKPPYPIPDTKETRKDFAGYLMSVKNADTCFGQVIACLKEEGLLEDTVILFTTDHGLANPYAKCTLFDSGIGVNLMLRIPGSGANGRVFDSLVSHVDVFPTLCDILQLPKPEWLEGCSLMPMLEGRQEKVRDEIFAEINFHTSYEPVRCVRTERYKYIRYWDEEWRKTNLSNIDESGTKAFFMERGLTERRKAGEALYDLVYDPGERCNVAGQPEYEEIRRDMAKRLYAVQERTEDPILEGPISVQEGWKVNRRECEKASSKNPEDYVSPGGNKKI